MFLRITQSMSVIRLLVTEHWLPYMTGVQIFLSANAAMICVQREMGKRIKMTTKGSKNHQGKGFMWTKLKMVIAPMFALIGHWKTVRYTIEYSNVTTPSLNFQMNLTWINSTIRISKSSSCSKPYTDETKTKIYSNYPQ